MAAARFRVLNIAETTMFDFEEYCKEEFQAVLVSFSTNGSQKSTATAVISCHVTDTVKLLEQPHKYLKQELVILPEVYESVSATVSKHWMNCFNQQQQITFEKFLSVCDSKNIENIKITTNSNGQKVLTGNIEIIQIMMKAIHEADGKLLSNPEKGSGITEGCSGNSASGNSQSNASAVKSGVHSAIDEQDGDTNGNVAAPSSRQRKLKTSDKLELKRSVSQEEDDRSQVDRQKEAVSAAGFSVDGARVSDGGAGVSVGSASRVRQLKKGPPTAGTQQVDSHHTSVSDERMCRSLDSSVCRSIDISRGKVDYIEQHLSKELNKIKDQLLKLYVDQARNQWIVMAKSRETAERAVTQLTELMSRVVVGTVKVPLNVDLDGIHAVCVTNENKSVEIDLTNIDSGVCEIYGLEPHEVDSTELWLKRTFSQIQLQYTLRSGNMQPSSDGIMARDNTSSHQPRSSSQDTKSAMTHTKMAVTLNATSTSNRLEFTTHSGLRVYVYQGDMLHQSTDIIVNSANDQLAHGAGLARAILDAGGAAIDTESRAIIKDRGALKMGEVVATSAGKLNYRYILHAVPPSGHQLNTGNKEECMKALRQVFYKSMELSCELNCKSVTLPPFGAGIFAVPVDIIMGAAFDALQEFDEFSKRQQVSLQEVHFISNDAKLAADMIEAFNNRVVPCSTGGGSTGGHSGSAGCRSDYTGGHSGSAGGRSDYTGGHSGSTGGTNV